MTVKTQLAFLNVIRRFVSIPDEKVFVERGKDYFGAPDRTDLIGYRNTVLNDQTYNFDDSRHDVVVLDVFGGDGPMRPMLDVPTLIALHRGMKRPVDGLSVVLARVETARWTQDAVVDAVIAQPEGKAALNRAVAEMFAGV